MAYRSLAPSAYLMRRMPADHEHERGVFLLLRFFFALDRATPMSNFSWPHKLREGMIEDPVSCQLHSLLAELMN